MIGMFSEKYRFPKIIILSTLLVILCFYCYRGVPLHLKEVAQESNISYFANSANDGKPLKIGFAKVIKVLEDGNFTIQFMKRRIVVKGKQLDIRPGYRVSLTGYLAGDDQFVAETILVHKYRWLKKLISALTTLLVVFIIIKQYKVQIKERIIVEREKCLT